MSDVFFQEAEHNLHTQPQQQDPYPEHAALPRLALFFSPAHNTNFLLDLIQFENYLVDSFPT
jgi:hypothetical protein